MSNLEQELNSLSDKLEAVDFQKIDSDIKKLEQLEKQLRQKKENDVTLAGGNVGKWVVGLASAGVFISLLFQKDRNPAK